MEAVPYAIAAIAWAPPTRNTRRIPLRRAAKSAAASTDPSAAGGVQTISSGTPATVAGTDSIAITDGNEPLPRGTYSPAEAIGVSRSPDITPGRICFVQSAAGR
jgi:hypothetical protein